MKGDDHSGMLELLGLSKAQQNSIKQSMSVWDTKWNAASKCKRFTATESMSLMGTRWMKNNIRGRILDDYMTSDDVWFIKGNKMQMYCYDGKEYATRLEMFKAKLENATLEASRAIARRNHLEVLIARADSDLDYRAMLEVGHE